MNRTGIMVDVSHISDSAFFQVLEITQVPVIASHSSCRVFTPGFERNMNDDQLRALARNGGVGDSLPTGLKDVSQYPNLIYELLKRGYSEKDIEKICYQNVFRVWNKTVKKSNI